MLELTRMQVYEGVVLVEKRVNKVLYLGRHLSDKAWPHRVAFFDKCNQGIRPVSYRFSDYKLSEEGILEIAVLDGIRLKENEADYIRDLLLKRGVRETDARN